MFTTSILRSTEKFNDLLSKKSKTPATPATPATTTDVAAYQSLTVIKRLSKAKFPVYLTSSKVNKQNYAMKVFSHKNGKPHPYFHNEARFSILKHPNVIDIIHQEAEKDTVYQNEVKKVSYILMEFAPHGDLFDFVTKYRESIDEKLVRTLFRQLIDGVEYLHESHVAHLDLKPENLLIGADCSLRVADFDLSFVHGDQKIYSRGTRYYRGPEFFKTEGDISELKNPGASDIYSAGVILFILQCGGIYPHSENTPLEGLDLVDLMYNNNADFWKKHSEIQGKSGSFFTKEFKELFNGMTKLNPEERMTIKQIKQSKWYNGSFYSPSDLQKKMKKILKV